MMLAPYLRVSSQGQADHGFGLDVQREDIEAWAAREGHELTEPFVDEGVSGSNGVTERDALPLAIHAIISGEAEGLVVHRLDRLARHLGVQEAILAHVWDAGGKVFSADEGEIVEEDGSDPYRTAMRQMRGVFAQLERSLVVARMKAGRMAKKARGGYIGGPPPFGWRAHEGELVEHEEEQKTLALIRELLDMGLNSREIAEQLNYQRTPTKYGPGYRWHENSVRRVVRRMESVDERKG